MVHSKYIVDNNHYDLGKDVFHKRHEVKEIHPLLLKIVLELDRICRKYNIGYALSFGSALGIYNYQGFIPWDDDIDVAIDYFDVERLIEAFKEDLGEEFSFDCYEDNKRFNVLIPTFKLRLKNSYIKETYHWTLPNRCRNGDGIFIDIVAFMGVPKDKKEHIKLLKYAKHRMVYYVALDAFLRIQPYRLKEKLKNYEKAVANKYRYSDYVSQTVIIPFQDWAEKKENLAFPREVIYPFQEYEFCGHKLYSFNDLEMFCKLCYGEKALKKEVNGILIDPQPTKYRKAKHSKTYNLYSNSKN